ADLWPGRRRGHCWIHAWREQGSARAHAERFRIGFVRLMKFPVPGLRQMQEARTSAAVVRKNRDFARSRASLPPEPDPPRPRVGPAEYGDQQRRCRAKSFLRRFPPRRRKEVKNRSCHVAKSSRPPRDIQRSTAETWISHAIQTGSHTWPRSWRANRLPDANLVNLSPRGSRFGSADGLPDPGAFRDSFPRLQTDSDPARSAQTGIPLRRSSRNAFLCRRSREQESRVARGRRVPIFGAVRHQNRKRRGPEAARASSLPQEDGRRQWRIQSSPAGRSSNECHKRTGPYG